MQTFSPILEGKDVVGRAKTGCGKTLAFALPAVRCLSRDTLSPFEDARSVQMTGAISEGPPVHHKSKKH